MTDTTQEIDITETVHGILDDLTDELPDAESVISVLSLIVALAVDAFDTDLDEVIETIRAAHQSMATKH